MPDEQQSTGQQTQAGQTAGDSSAGTQNTEHMIPKSRFDEVNTRAADQARELEELKRQLNERDQAHLKEQGKFKELADQRGDLLAKTEPLAKRAEVLEGRIRASNEKRIEQVPAALRSMVEPLKASLQPEELSDWLDSNWQLLTARQAPDLNAGEGGSGGGSKPVNLTAEERQLAQLAGMTDQQYAAFKK